MKDTLYLFQIIKNKPYIVLSVLLFVVLLFKVAASGPADKNKPGAPAPIFSIEYMEDTTGLISLSEVQAEESGGSFLKHAGSTLSIGQSRSTWWIRVKLDNFPSGDGQMYLSINNPTVEKAVLYIPVITATGVQYKTLDAGWGYKSRTQDEGFSYPVFKLTGNIAYENFIYLQLSSPFYTKL